MVYIDASKIHVWLNGLKMYVADSSCPDILLVVRSGPEVVLFNSSIEKPISHVSLERHYLKKKRNNVPSSHQ